MISINGRNFLGKNKIIIKGRIINEGGLCNSQAFDATKIKDANNLDKVIIDSTFADVNVLVSDSSNAEVHFYGHAELDGNITFDVQVVNRELRVILKYIGNYFNGELQLDITLPQKTFEVISVTSSSSAIVLNNGVSANHLIVKNMAGDLKTSATFTNASINTVNGDIRLDTNATTNINLDISTMSGNVSVNLNNIGHINLSTNPIGKMVQNTHKDISGYTADVSISSMSGNIKIK